MSSANVLAVALTEVVRSFTYNMCKRCNMLFRRYSWTLMDKFSNADLKVKLL